MEQITQSESGRSEIYRKVMTGGRSAAENLAVVPGKNAAVPEWSERMEWVVVSVQPGYGVICLLEGWDAGVPQWTPFNDIARVKEAVTWESRQAADDFARMVCRDGMAWALMPVTRRRG